MYFKAIEAFDPNFINSSTHHLSSGEINRYLHRNFVNFR